MNIIIVKEFFTNIREVLVNPGEFFTTKVKEPLKPALMYYTAFLVIILLLALPTVKNVIEPLLGQYTFSLTPTLYGVIVIVGGIYSFIEVFLGIGVTFGIIKLFKGTNTFRETAKIMIYGATPEYLFQIMFGVVSLVITSSVKSIVIALIIVNAAVVAYRVYIQTIGIAHAHSVDKFKAVLAVFIIPYALVFLIVLLLKQFVPMPIAP